LVNYTGIALAYSIKLLTVPRWFEQSKS